MALSKSLSPAWQGGESSDLSRGRWVRHCRRHTQVCTEIKLRRPFRRPVEQVSGDPIRFPHRTPARRVAAPSMYGRGTLERPQGKTDTGTRLRGGAVHRSPAGPRRPRDISGHQLRGGGQLSQFSASPNHRIAQGPLSSSLLDARQNGSQTQKENRPNPCNHLQALLLSAVQPVSYPEIGGTAMSHQRTVPALALRPGPAISECPSTRTVCRRRRTPLASLTGV
jgi:hypothetical protein